MVINSAMFLAAEDEQDGWVRPLIADIPEEGP